MKDLYSAHTSEKDLMAYYEKAKEAYQKALELDPSDEEIRRHLTEINAKSK